MEYPTRITNQDLLELIEEVTTTLGQILDSHRGLTEGLFDRNQTIQSQQRIAALKKKIEDEKARLAQSKEFEKRRKDLEQLRKKNHQSNHEKTPQTEHKSSIGIVPILDGRGRVVGWIQNLGNNRVNIFNSKGRVVAREMSGKTFDEKGLFSGMGRQGLRILGMTQKN